MRALKFGKLFDANLTKYAKYSSAEPAKHLQKSLKSKASTIDLQDVAHFTKMSDKWWNVMGEMAALHALNPLRIQFVRDGLANTGYQEVNPALPLTNVKILDVGCGGGILAEPLARIGADVTGIDASVELINTAKEHSAKDSGLAGRLDYIQTTIEEHACSNSKTYDAVVASEILEHVNEKELFLKSCIAAVKPGGSLFVTTINKTLPSWLGAIIAAEYLLKIAPIGTHDWNKFIEPHETGRVLDMCGCKTKLIHGMIYNPLKNEWSWTASTSINYAIHAIKEKEN